jgi:hypothetical protein
VNDTDEKKLVLTWIETLKDVSCLKVNESGNWVLSETGRTWIGSTGTGGAGTGGNGGNGGRGGDAIISIGSGHK